RDTDEQLVGDLSGLQLGPVRTQIQPTYPPAGRIADGAFREGLHNCRRGLRRDRDWRLHRADHIDLGGVSHSTTEQIVVPQQRNGWILGDDLLDSVIAKRQGYQDSSRTERCT